MADQPDRYSFAPFLAAAGLDVLTPASTAEDIDRALIHLRELLPQTMDKLSRETLRLDLRQKHPYIPAAMIDTALAPPPHRSTEPEGPKKSQATRLVDLALEDGVELWHSPTGDPHVSIPVGGHLEHYGLTTRHVRDWLARRHHHETGGAPGSQAIADALNVLAGLARFDGAEHAVAVRVAGYGGAVYVDLGDPSWRAVEVTPAGWWIEPRPPVRLVRARGMLPLPTPVTGGSVDALRDLIHVATDDDYRLLVGWLIGALRPTGPYLIQSLVGEAGAGKTTVARVLRRLIDPHVAEVRAEPRTIDDIMIAAMRSWIVLLDNLSHVAPWLSDGLCRLSTGGALTKRELYTDADETIIEAMRPVILTSITDILTRGDALDRANVTTVPILPESKKMPEVEFWRRFDAIAPGVLGALLDAIVSALKFERAITIPELPRMADWAVWTTAAEPALGWPAQSILAAYQNMRGGAIETSLEGDSVAVAIRRLPLPWEGTAGDFLARLTPAGRPPRGWPESPRGMSAALRRLAPGLRHVGIDVVLPTDEDRRGHDRARVITISRCSTPAENTPARSSAPSARASELAIPPTFSGDSGADDVVDGLRADETSSAPSAQPSAPLTAKNASNNGPLDGPAADAADADGWLQGRSSAGSGTSKETDHAGRRY